MGRSPCCDDSGLKKGPWTPEEDEKLINYIQQHGHGSWRALPKHAGLNRCGKSCRLRWTNYLRPDIKRGKFSQEEEQIILNLHSLLGNKWSAIATHLPGRTDNEIKNFWNTHLKKKLLQMGIDPMTHQPRTDIFSSIPHLIALASLKELIENPHFDEHAKAMRLQAEAAQLARLNTSLQSILQPAFPQQTFPDLATFSLLNTLKEASVLSHLDAGASPPPPPSDGFLYESMPLLHLPELQIPCTLPQTGTGGPAECPAFEGVAQGEKSPQQTPSPVPGSMVLAPVPLADSGAGVGDACSSSSYGGSQMWSDLLDDHFFTEI